MRLIGKFVKLFVVVSCFSVGLWGLGCAQETPTSSSSSGGSETPNEPESGSTTGGGVDVPEQDGSEAENSDNAEDTKTDDN